MLKIRLRRIGRTHEPFYRIVVTEETSPIQGKFIAQLGNYNPKTKELNLKQDEASDWMNKGAKPSNTVAKLMKKEKMSHKSIVIHKSRKISKKELEIKKAEEEKAKAAAQAQQEQAKEAWEKESTEIASTHEDSDTRLKEEATEQSADQTQEPDQSPQEPTETKTNEAKSDKPADTDDSPNK
ncbi:MAG: 30S ribosomal protein S16 [bacterium]|nr:30S ribosomal protein S16 [bacterium]